MNLTVNARHMDVTDAIREYVESKASKLPKFYDGIQSIEVILDTQADNAVVEIVAHAKRKHTFVASHRDSDLYACMDACMDKIITQLRRHKDRTRDRKGLVGHGEAMEPPQQ